MTPGLVNTHHHLYQNLTRAFAPALTGGLFDWLVTLYPLWARLDEEAAYVSAYVGLTELALGGCTTSTDHLYVHPRGAGDLITAEVAAARDLGMRFHPTRGSMSLSVKDGGLPPDSVVQDDDEILAESQRLVDAHHDRSPLAMTRIALAPCSPFSVSTSLMTRTAELAERLDVRLHTHLCETQDEDAFCLETFGRRPVDYLADVGWMTDRTWLAHVVWPSPDEVTRLGAARRGGGALPVVEHDPGQRAVAGGRAAGRGRPGRAGRRRLGVGGLRVAVAGGADGDAAGQAPPRRGLDVRAGRPRDGHPRRRGLPRARPARSGELSVGACGDLVVWGLEGVRVRRRAVGPGRGVAALRAGVGPAHRRRRAAGRRGRRPGARRAWTSSSPSTAGCRAAMQDPVPPTAAAGRPAALQGGGEGLEVVER